MMLRILAVVALAVCLLASAASAADEMTIGRARESFKKGVPDIVADAYWGGVAQGAVEALRAVGVSCPDNPSTGEFEANLRYTAAQNSTFDQAIREYLQIHRCVQN